MPKPRRERMEISFHRNGKRIGPSISLRGMPAKLANTQHNSMAGIMQNVDGVETRIVRTREGPKTIGFTGVSNAAWKNIFGKRKKK
mgnify:CR=1 FL=1